MLVHCCSPVDKVFTLLELFMICICWISLEWHGPTHCMYPLNYMGKVVPVCFFQSSCCSNRFASWYWFASVPQQNHTTVVCFHIVFYFLLHPHFIFSNGHHFDESTIPILCDLGWVPIPAWPPGILVPVCKVLGSFLRYEWSLFPLSCSIFYITHHFQTLTFSRTLQNLGYSTNLHVLCLSFLEQIFRS